MTRQKLREVRTPLIALARALSDRLGWPTEPPSGQSGALVA